MDKTTRILLLGEVKDMSGISLEEIMINTFKEIALMPTEEQKAEANWIKLVEMGTRDKFGLESAERRFLAG